MKNNKWIYGLLMLSCFVFIQSCAFYKTSPVVDLSSSNLKEVASQKEFVTIHQRGNDQHFLIEKAEWENEAISGNLSPIVNLNYPEGKDYFRGAQSKQARKYLHLETDKSLEKGPLTIDYSNILAAKTHELDAIPSIMGTTGILALLTVAGAAAFVAIACNCPYVATINPDGSKEFQGSLFPGAIFKPLERKDHLIMKNLREDQKGQLKVVVSNELDEIQYIDEVELFAVSHSKDILGLFQNEKLISYSKGNLPVSAFNQKSVQVDLEFLKDDETFSFDDTPFENELSSLTLSFDTENLGLQPILVIRGQQTELLEHTAEVFFRGFGSDFPRWVSKMNKADPEKYKQNAIDQGIALNVYVKEDNEWIYQGSYENAGGTTMRNLAIPIQLNESKTKIDIKLETAFGLWSLDQISLTSDYSTDITMDELELISAINQDGDDVKMKINSTDELYLEQRLKGTSTELNFKSSEAENVTYVLSGTGYYNHERNYTAKANNKFLRKMKNTKFSTHRLAQEVQLYKDTYLASNE